MAKKLTPEKAQEMLHNPPHGKPLTEKQRKFFGYISNQKNGGWLEKYDEGGKVPIKDSKGVITNYDINSPEYKTLYESGKLAAYDESTDTYNFPELQEVEVSAPRLYNYEGCVSGMCHDYAKSNKLSLEDFRKMNNLYGDAWKIMGNSYGENITPAADYSNLRVNDMVSMSRKKFDTDAKRGIPEKNQHIGRISKIENGIPYVKHYVGNKYYEEPINNIKQFTNYNVEQVKRLPEFKDLVFGNSNFNFDKDYSPSSVEAEVLAGIKDKKNIQSALRLDNKEFDNLSKLAYAMLGAESSFGKSKRTLYRMALPDFIQKAIKVADDAVRGKDIYDDNINNLSQGYASIKESSLHGVSDNTGKLTNAQINKKVREGDYSDLERTNNYLYHAMQKLGVNPDNLENGENSFKAIMSALSFYKKRNPNASSDDLIRSFTGKKNIKAYRSKVDKYLKNIDNIPGNSEESSTWENVLGGASHLANVVNTGLKDVAGNIVGGARDVLPGSINQKQFVADLLGSKTPVSENSLSDDEIKTLENIVRNNIKDGKLQIEYGDYKTSKGKNDDIGSKSAGFTKLVKSDPAYALKTLLGQANIRQVGKNKYIVEDTFDYNDKGKSFGVTDDMKKRGVSLYSLIRSLGRNYGSQNTQGADVRIPIEIKEDGGQVNYNDASVSFPPNYVGQGYDITGRDYSPAWGGQFEDGGPIKRFLQPTQTFMNIGYNPKENGISTEYSTSIGGPGEIYLVPGYRQGRVLSDPEATFNMYGEHLGGPFKTVQAAEDFAKLRHQYVEKNQNIPSPFKTRDYAMGGSLPGAVGFTYARTQSPAPSNGPYAKKTKASAQNGIKVLGEDEPIQLDPEEEFLYMGKPYEEQDRSREFSNFIPKVVEDLYPIDININQKNLGLAQHTFTHQPGMHYDENLEGTPSESYMLKRTANSFPTDEDVRLNVQMPSSPRDVNFISNYKGAIGEVDQYPTSVPFEGEKHWNIDRFIIDPHFGSGIPALENDATDKVQQRRNVLADMYKYYLLQNKGDKDASWKQANEFMTKEIDPRISGPMYEKLRGNISYSPGTGITSVVDEDYVRNFNQYKNSANLPDSERSEMEREFLKNPTSDKQAKDLAMDWLINYKKMSPKEAESYYKKLPKKQNGAEMKYYQDGLDFKPKSISKNGKKIIKDDMGQWAHPGKITKIGSNQITMQGVPYPVLGISDTGDTQMMYPNQDYTYHGSSVTEYPMMKEGGALQLTKLDQLTNFTNYNTKQPGGWLDKYQD